MTTDQAITALKDQAEDDDCLACAIDDLEAWLSLDDESVELSYLHALHLLGITDREEYWRQRLALMPDEAREWLQRLEKI